MHLLCRKGFLDLAIYLIKHGADINIPDEVRTFFEHTPNIPSFSHCVYLNTVLYLFQFRMVDLLLIFAVGMVMQRQYRRVK